MKKSCRDCRALTNGVYGFKCDLGYQLQQIEFYSTPIIAKPIQQCPKPRTYEKYLELREIRK